MLGNEAEGAASQEAKRAAIRTAELFQMYVDRICKALRAGTTPVVAPAAPKSVRFTPSCLAAISTQVGPLDHLPW